MNVILFILALIFAIPTYGLSVVAWFIVLYVQNYIKVKYSKYRANKKMALEEISSVINTSRNRFEVIRRLPDPTWLTKRSDEFFYSISQRAIENKIPKEVVSRLFESLEVLSLLTGIAAIMERKGASFVEQQTFVLELLIDANENNAFVNKRNLETLINYFQKQNNSSSSNVEVFSIDEDLKERATDKINRISQQCSDLFDFSIMVEEPSWSKRNQVASFCEPVKGMLYQKGIPLRIVNNLFTHVSFIGFVVALAGVVEQEGGSFFEQQIFVTEFIYDLYEKGLLENFSRSPISLV